MVRKDGVDIGIPVSVITDCDVRPYDVDPTTKDKIFNEKEAESAQAKEERDRKYTNGPVRGFTSPRWTLEYCIAMSCLSDDFHKAVHYGKKILNAQEYISLTDKVTNKEKLEAAIQLAFEHDAEVIVEETIKGFEVGCAILGTDELLVGRVDEIELSSGFFDYTEKYTLKTSKIYMPARVDAETEKRIQDTGVAIVFRS